MKLKFDDGIARRVNLEEYGYGVALVVEEDSGVRWYVAGLQPDGLLTKYGCIDPGHGLQVNKHGRIKTVKEF